METAGVETVEKRLHVFSTVHRAWKNSGKKQLRRVFHSSHSPYCYLYLRKKNKEEKTLLMEGLGQNWNGQVGARGVKTT